MNLGNRQAEALTSFPLPSVLVNSAQCSSVLLFGLLLQLLPGASYSQAVVESQEPWVLTAS